MDTSDLMDITNIIGGPWYQVYKEDDKEYRQIVPKKESYNFYVSRNLLEKRLDKNYTESLGQQPKKLVLKRKNAD